MLVIVEVIVLDTEIPAPIGSRLQKMSKGSNKSFLEIMLFFKQKGFCLCLRSESTLRANFSENPRGRYKQINLREDKDDFVHDANLLIGVGYGINQFFKGSTIKPE